MNGFPNTQYTILCQHCFSVTGHRYNHYQTIFSINDHQSQGLMPSLMMESISSLASVTKLVQMSINRKKSLKVIVLCSLTEKIKFNENCTKVPLPGALSRNACQLVYLGYQICNSSV